MPYKSDAQRRFMHARHPGIAAKWDAEIRAKKKGKVSKMSVKGEGWLKPVIAGTVAGGLANQFPRVQDIEREHRRRAKKKGAVKKMLITSDDPDFNQAAAQKAFDLVMKMDDDTAEMYTTIVVGELYEADIEKNLGTLQRHLNQVISKQLESVKQAHLRLVAKGMDADQAVAYAQALAMFDGTISKVKNPYEHGYHFKESDFRRDPTTGRFQMKVSERQTKELSPKMATAILGTDTPHKVVVGGKKKKLSEADRIRFQDEYRQLSDFLGAVSQSAGGRGNQQVLLQFKDKTTGETWSQIHASRTPPKDLLADPDTRLMGAIAKPETLTAGGAAFGLATAVGGSMSPQSVATANAAGAGAGTFAEQWLRAGEGDRASNAKLYGRTAAAGQFLSQVGPPGSKTQLAGKFAQIVGNAGPQAEMVLGPTTRKTAYRYRGTEKTPERAMVRAYGQGVAQAKLYSPTKELEHGVREPRRSGKPGAAPTPAQMALARAERENRGPTWDERELGRRAVVDHLRAKMPQKSLYDLQLAAGNTPPSEGVIINAEGQLATQAVGYGDDHYLPFNLKHLKALKGGEYIRTRSVGGLTSEDIYTGLISGARQVTVTSRSGTYTMTFEPDFRGGRRHSDKARRMTRRYEQLLDAVQSQQVDRIDIDPEMRLQIENEVKEEMSGPGWRRSDIQDAIKERIDEFKENPYITEQDEKRAELIINARAAGASEPERAKIRAQVMDDLMDQKETKFRLNSAGYKAALDALQEQFPYYISKPRWTPPRDAEKKIDTALDRGYVEPGRNRPTSAKAGLYGTVKGQSGKFSAAQADYQGARGKLRPVEDVTSESVPGSKKDETELTDKEKRRAAAAAIKADQSMVTAAKKIQTAVNMGASDEDKERFAEQLNYDENDLRDPIKFSRFTTMAERYFDVQKNPTLRREWEQSIGHRESKPFNRDQATVFSKVPATFPERAYSPGADQKYVSKELDRLDREGRESPVHRKPYSAMTEDEYRSEHNALVELAAKLERVPGKLDNDELEEAGLHPNSPGVRGLNSDREKILDRMELIQRSRALTRGMTAEQRTARETRAVLHDQPKTKEEYEGPAKQAMNNAEYIDTLRRQLEDSPDSNDEDTERLRGLADAWRNSVAEKEINTPDDLQRFMETHEDEIQHFHAIERKHLGGSA